jgi:hypothetical protein
MQAYRPWPPVARFEALGIEICMHFLSSMANV